MRGKEPEIGENVTFFFEILSFYSMEVGGNMNLGEDFFSLIFSLFFIEVTYLVSKN